MEIKTIPVGFLKTNCYIITSEDEALVIDPGGDLDKIVNGINQSIKKVKILNTHFHYDHTLVNNELREKFNAEILIHEDEKDFIDFKADKFLKNGDIVKVGKHEFKVMHTPGHSEGSICLLSEKIFFSGDTLFENGYGRTDLPGGNQEKMNQSLSNLRDVLEEGTTIYPGHGESFKWGNTN